MFRFWRKSASAKGTQGSMEKVERCNREIGKYISEGLMRVVFQTTDFTVACIVNSAYVVFVHGAIDKTNNLTAALGLRGSEFKTFMEEPTMESLKWFNYACQTQGINRAFTFDSKLADKFRELKKKLDAQHKIEVDLDLERRLVEEAKRKYDHIG